MPLLNCPAKADHLKLHVMNWKVLFFILLLISSCKVTKDLGAKEQEEFILEIIDDELIQPNPDLDFLINFTLTNNSNSDVWVPNPKNPSGSSVLESPEFFSISVSAEDCARSDHVSKINKKSIDDYTKIPMNGSATFEMNPNKLFPGWFCDEIYGNVDFQITYIVRSFQLAAVKQSGLPEEIVSNLLIDTLKSQVIHFDIK